MRFLIKVSWPVEAGNAAAKEGFKDVGSILEELKPEAAYFYEENGKRPGCSLPTSRRRHRCLP